MAPRVDPVQSDAELPARTSVVVIGGGIIGTSTAFFLARKGVPVVLCEKGHIAGEQSSRNWGWVRKMGRDPREIPLIIEALRLWEGMNELVEAETGFREARILYACETDRSEERRVGQECTTTCLTCDWSSDVCSSDLAGGLVREGPHRRRAVEPQLGLGPQDGPRPARDPAHHRGPAPVGGDERAGGGRDRLPRGRHPLRLRDRQIGRAAGRARVHNYVLDM